MSRPDRPLRRLPAVHERPWAVAVYLACAALVGLAWAAPLAGVLGAVAKAYPRGDAELFDPGALMLLEAIQRSEPAGPAIGAAWIVTAIVALPLGLLALGFALAQLGTPGLSRPSWALVRSTRALPSLALVGLAALLANALIGAVIMIGGGAIVRAAWPIPPSRDVARLALMGLVVVASLAISAIHDLASASAVVGPPRAYMSVRAALLVVWRAPIRVAWRFAWRFAVGSSAIAIAFAAGHEIGHRTALAVALSALVHQAGLAAAGWTRLSWLSESARLVRPVIALVTKESKIQASEPRAEGEGSTEASVSSGEANVSSGEANVSSGEANVSSGEANVSSGEANIGSPDANIGSPEASVGAAEASVGSPTESVGSLGKAAQPRDEVERLLDEALRLLTESERARGDLAEPNEEIERSADAPQKPSESAGSEGAPPNEEPPEDPASRS